MMDPSLAAEAEAPLVRHRDPARPRRARLRGVALLPKAEENPPEVFSNKQAYNIAAHEKAVRLTRADRKVVNETIDVVDQRRRQARRTPPPSTRS